MNLSTNFNKPFDLSNLDINRYQLNEKLSEENDLLCPIDFLPIEIMIKIFSLFPIKLLGSFPLVSKKWKNISEEKTLWIQAKFNTQKNLNTSQYSIEHTYDWKEINANFPIEFEVSVVKNKLHTHIKNLAKAEAILTPKKSIGTFNDIPILLEGFGSGLVLQRLGFYTFEKLEKFATMVQDDYKNHDLWLTLAIEYTSQGNIEEARFILSTKLNNEWSTLQQNTLLKQIIYKLVSEGELSQAFDLFNSHREKTISPFLMNDLDSVLSIFKINAIEKKDYKLLEKLFDGFYTKYIHRIIEISLVVYSLLKDNEFPIVCKFVKKYTPFLDQLTPNEQEAYNNYKKCVEAVKG